MNIGNKKTLKNEGHAVFSTMLKHKMLGESEPDKAYTCMYTYIIMLVTFHI